VIENKTAYIIAAGPIESYEYVKNNIPKDAFILCADGGIRHCKKILVNPNVLISDFDSSEKEHFENCEVITFPCEKDDTDFSLCIKKAIELGFKKIIAFGALGGRIDHTIGAIQMLEYCLQNGMECALCDYKNKVFMLPPNKKISIPLNKNENVSLFSYSKECTGVTLNGMKYPLEDATLTRDFPLAISNKVISQEGSVIFKKGVLLLVLSQD
jgi:thiamine pyrophosphokinase